MAIKLITREMTIRSTTQNDIRRRGSAILLTLFAVTLPLQSTSAQSLEIPGILDTPVQADHSANFRPDVVERSMLPAEVSVSLDVSLLRRFVDRTTVESDNVATCVMEADVRGTQTTTTGIQLECVPGEDKAYFSVRAQGTVASSTVGMTPQARITSLGQHTFNVVKPVIFDGERFLTKPAYGTLQAHQTPQAVQSLASGVPLLGRIGDQIAWNEVYRRMPASDSIVVRRVADDVLPKVNRGIDNELVRLNQSWQVLRQSVDQFVPDSRHQWTAQTSERDILITVRDIANVFAVDQSRAVDSVRPHVTDREAAVLTVSDTAVNSWLEKQPWRGATITDTGLQELVRTVQATEKPNLQQLLTALKRLTRVSTEPMLFSIKLSDEQPVELAFIDGICAVRLRFQIVPKGGMPSQMHLVEIRLQGEATEADQWSIAVRDINAGPASRQELPDAWTALMNQQAAQLLNHIPPTVLPRRFNLTSMHEKLPPLRLYRIQTADGWLRISVEDDSPPGTSTSLRPRYRQGFRPAP